MLKERKSALQALLNDPQPMVRQAAASSLDAVEAIADIEQLLDKLEDGDRGEKIAAAYALERINVAKIFPPLIEALKSDDADLRLVVVRVLGIKKHPKTISALVKMLDDIEVGIQIEAAKALGGFADRRLPEYLAPLVKREEQLALTAIEAIGRLGFPEGEAPLFEAMRDRRPEIRARAAEVLGGLHL